MSSYRSFIGVDYSGAGTADDALPGIRIYRAGPGSAAREVRPAGRRGPHWSRRGVFHWLAAVIEQEGPVLVGVDHAFSFPLAYFERHELVLDWGAFLDDFCAHWPVDAKGTSVESVRRGMTGQGMQRGGESRWRRLADRCSPGAKSPFHFDVPGSVAKSTHAGLPWLRRLRQRLPDQLHCWPFDGWCLPSGKSVVAEVYPALWNGLYPRGGRTGDQQDAYVVARRLKDVAAIEGLECLFSPVLDEEMRRVATTEGWILGVPGIPA